MKYTMYYPLGFEGISCNSVELGINVEGGIFWRKLVHKSNKRGVEGGFLFCGGWIFLKSVSVGSTFIREMRVHTLITI